MTVNDALKIMNGTADEFAAKFAACGVSVKKDVRYLNRVFAEIQNPKRAKYMTVTLTLYTEGLEEDYGYCLSIGVELHRSGITEAQLEKSRDEFAFFANAALGRLENSENPTEVLYKLSSEANEEHEKLLAELSDMQKRWQKRAGIASVICIVVMIVVIIVLSL